MKVYLLDVTSIPECAVSEYLHILDEDRQNQIARYRKSADRLRSFGAGMTLYYAWRRQYGERTMPRTAREKGGKPYFVGEAIPFSLSHSGNYAACVLGDEHGGALGLDIQEPRQIRAAVAERFLSEGEKEQVRAGTDPCVIWSRKESLAKYDGGGLRRDLRLFDTADDTVRIWSCRTEDDEMLRICQDWAEDGIVRICSCRTEDGYAVSVCTREIAACSLVHLTWDQIKKELPKV